MLKIWYNHYRDIAERNQPMNTVFFAPWKNDDSKIQIRFSTFESKNGFCVHELHFHEYFEIEFYVKGSVTNIINGQSYDMIPGTLSLLSPNDFHKIIKSDGELLIYKLTFLPCSISREAMDTLETFGYPFIRNYIGKAFDDLINKFELLANSLELSDKNTPLGLFRTQICASDILLQIFENPEECRNVVSSLSEDNPVVCGMRYINEHLYEDIRVSDIAASVYLSEDYFGHIFKKYTSMNISEYIIEQRIKRAYYMLLDTDMTINDIATMVGYNSVSLFYRHFKRYFDLNPNKIRKNKR